MDVFLGVDGGGTKTAFVLVDATGRVLGSVEGASAYHLEHGLDHVRQVFVDGVAALTAQSGVDAAEIRFAFFAIPTYGESSREIPILDEVPAAALGHHRYRVGNDMIAGWAGSLAEADGINVVAGTGSVTYGQRSGLDARVGGWGELFGDEGSGYWIGLETLASFSRMSDGRLARTRLYDLIRTSVDLPTDLDLIDVVFEQWGRSRGRIATLAPLVVDAAAEEDAVAVDIIDRAVAQLVELVDTTRRQLGFEVSEPIPVSYSGGVFRAEFVRSRFIRALEARSSAYDIREPLFSSHVGAALHAAKLAGRPLVPAALDRLAKGQASGS